MSLGKAAEIAGVSKWEMMEILASKNIPIQYDAEFRFSRWINACHDLFEMFEGEYDAYPLSRRWVDEWFSNGKFIVEQSDKQRLTNLINSLNFEVFGISDSKMQDNIRSQLIELLEKLTEARSNIGFAISFYLFTWNIRRFKEYFAEIPSFSLLEYFEQVGKELEALKDLIQFFRDKNLLSNEVYKKEVRNIFSKINKILKTAGVKHNELVGTIKILHILAPCYFPLLDNPITKAVLKRSSISIKLYIEWMQRLKNWLKRYENVISKLEAEHKLSILKLIDEALYIMCSVNLRKRVSKVDI